MKHTQNLYFRLVELQRDLPTKAPCENIPEVFFPEDIVDPAMAELATHRAKTLCQTCPLLKPCADYAIQARLTSGIWGNTTPEERIHP